MRRILAVAALLVGGLAVAETTDEMLAELDGLRADARIVGRLKKKPDVADKIEADYEAVTLSLSRAKRLRRAYREQQQEQDAAATLNGIDAALSGWGGRGGPQPERYAQPPDESLLSAAELEEQGARVGIRALIRKYRAMGAKPSARPSSPETPKQVPAGSGGAATIEI